MEERGNREWNYRRAEWKRQIRRAENVSITECNGVSFTDLQNCFVGFTSLLLLGFTFCLCSVMDFVFADVSELWKF